MHGPLGDLGVVSPVLVAPMAGGAGTPALVAAAARAGGMGFLAGGYKTPGQLAEQIALVRASTDTFGVNLFVPNPVPVTPDRYRDYALALQVEGDRYGLDLAHLAIREDDDHWHDKLDVLLADPVPLVSFTFGVPPRAEIAALRRAGSAIAQTVTSPAEARLAADVGVDLLAVQAPQAGAHYGTFTPGAPPPDVTLPDLVTQVADAVGVPIVGAGGIGTAADVAAALAAGADAVMVGTILLRTDESGAPDAHKAALAAAHGRPTVVTRSFTGRPARALSNAFTDRHDPVAPSGYPALHHLTSPLRRAAAAAGDAERLNLWAGTAHRFAREGPAASVLAGLAGAL